MVAPPDPGAPRCWFARSPGAPGEVLELRRRAARQPQRDEVRVRVLAAGLNFLDVLACRGDYPRQPPFPLPIGVELAGEVLAAGADSGLCCGARVLGIAPLPLGALAEELTVPAYLVHQVSAGVDVPALALAALPVNYQTAHFALHRLGRLAPGATVLVTAAAGGVGTATVQLAIAAGARVVALAGGAEKLMRCVAEGAALALDSGDDDVVEQVLEATGGRGVDIAVESVGGPSLGQALACAAFEGRVVSVGASAGVPTVVEPSVLVARNVALVGLSFGEHYPRRAPDLVAAVYDELLELLAAGRITPRIEAVPFEEVPLALERLAGRRTTGKLVCPVHTESHHTASVHNEPHHKGET